MPPAISAPNERTANKRAMLNQRRSGRLGEETIYCPCLHSNTQPSSPLPARYTDSPKPDPQEWDSVQNNTILTSLVYIYLYLAGSWAAVPWRACTSTRALKRISPGAKASSCQAVQHFGTEAK